MSAEPTSGAALGRQWLVVWGGVVLALLLALAAVLRLDPGRPPDLVLFVGRFHPLLVHLPIGFLLLAALLEGASRFDRRLRLLQHATAFALGVGAASAVLAALVGYLLALDGGYDASTVGRHKWLGFGVAAGAVLAVGLKVAAARRPHLDRAYVAVLVATVALLAGAGHYGGALTHGPGYLTYYMPAPLQRVLGVGGGRPVAAQDVPVDSLVVYRDLVHPIFERRCVSCHGPSKTKGELRMDTPERLEEGGEGGDVIAAGEPGQSELLRRVTLPLYHEDHMPPDGEAPLSVEETELIRWWIAGGASFDGRVAEVRDAGTPTSVQTVLARHQRQPGAVRRQGLYALDAPPPDSSALQRLQELEGVEVRFVAQDAPFLEVRMGGAGRQVDRAAVERLRPLYPQIAWLDLADAEVAPGALEAVAAMPHLTRLYLERTSVTDAALALLGGLEHLRYLNLYGTAVTDEGLQHLAEADGLEALYLWQTRVTDEGVRRFVVRRPGVEVSRGQALEADTAKADTT